MPWVQKSQCPRDPAGQSRHPKNPVIFRADTKCAGDDVAGDK